MQMSWRFPLALTVFLLPQFSSAVCTDNDCLRGCRSCEKPWPKNGSSHCPASGFECDLTGPYPYAFTTDAGEGGKDCLTLKCTGSRTLFVRGAAQAYLACFQGHWRLPGQDEQFLESTDNAVCLRNCGQNACASSITAKYASDGFTNANISSPTSNTCAGATCPADASLYGGYRNNSKPTRIPSGVLSCTGSGLWKDDSDRRFDFPACVNKSCPQLVGFTQEEMDAIATGYTLKPYPAATTFMSFQAVKCAAGETTAYLVNGEIKAKGTRFDDIPITCEDGTWYFNYRTEHSPLGAAKIGCIFP